MYSHISSLLLKQAREFGQFFLHILHSRRIVLSLSWNDFQQRFLGSYLGLAWSVIDPLSTIAVLYMVFGIFFQTGSRDGVPFVLWLVAGMVPWFFFAGAWSGATSSIAQYHYLVKKMVFRVSMLPLIKLLSVLPIHMILLLATLALFLARGYPPDWHLLQIVYYSIALFILLMGLSWLSSALFIFVKDTGQAIAVLLQFGFWLTPILWSTQDVPEAIRPYIVLNPMHYIVSGYRDAFIGSSWFWDKPLHTLYFWSATILIFIIGALVFARLRPHFADIL